MYCNRSELLLVWFEGTRESLQSAKPGIATLTA